MFQEEKSNQVAVMRPKERKQVEARQPLTTVRYWTIARHMTFLHCAELVGKSKTGIHGCPDHEDARKLK
jgi:hypothetical protein